MSTTNRFGDQGERASGSYVWSVAGKPVAVHLDLDVVERMSRELMRGYGVVPRRGIEVGGILLGSIEEAGGRTEVRIEDFEPVACTHTRGASYLLSEEEQLRFEDVLERWNPGGGRRTYAVGYYRSHTRQGLGLSEEDLEIFNRYFGGDANVALLVKPFATRASVGAFFIREKGAVRAEASYQEFPFRRRELDGAEPESIEGEYGGETEMPATTYPGIDYGADPAAGAEVAQEPERPSGKKLKSGWIWIPLSFIFLLLGVILGFQIALSVNTKLPASLQIDPYSLNLSATPAGESIHLQWDRNAPAIQSSTRASLNILHDGNEKTVTLDAGQLKKGIIIYRRASGNVRFRLEVFARDGISVSETLNYQLNPAPAK